MLKIDGAAAPSPSAMTVTLEPLGAAAERAASGDAVVDFMGWKRTIRLRWACLSAAALSALNRAVENRFFEVTFPDAVTGAPLTVACWCAARSAGVLRVQGGEATWMDVEMEWRER